MGHEEIVQSVTKTILVGQAEEKHDQEKAKQSLFTW